MAILVQLSGVPGTGKTFSVKSLITERPNEVYMINADKKSLSWAG